MGLQSSPAALYPPSSSDSPTRPLLALVAAGALGVQLLLWARISSDALRFGGLCAVAFVALVWSRRDSLRLEGGIFSTFAGAALLLGFFWLGSDQPGALFATLAPFVWGAGLALLASGFAGSLQFWREGIVLGAVALTPLIETWTLDLIGVDLTPATAQTTSYLLRIAGWSAFARDFMINLPGTSVIVAQGCSGLKTMYFLTGFAVLMLLLYPVAGLWRKAIVLIGAAAIGFVVNSLRVALLAIVSAEPGAFKFWHVQQGAMAFEILAVGLFLGYFYLLFPERPADEPTVKPAAE